MTTVVQYTLTPQDSLSPAHPKCEDERGPKVDCAAEAVGAERLPVSFNDSAPAIADLAAALPLLPIASLAAA